MSSDDDLVAVFETERNALRGVAYRMLGALGEAEDAVQQTFLKARAADRSQVRNLAAWLTTVTLRICLDMLRRRRHRNEGPLPIAAMEVVDASPDPEAEAVLAESVGLALLVVLDRLPPTQRVAFVLHDLFAVPFEEIAVVVGGSTAAAKQLASRARRRVRGAADDPPPADRAEHRAVVDAFLAASQGGDIEALLDLLAPDVVRRVDAAAAPAGVAAVLRGAHAVAGETKAFAQRARSAEVALVDGAPGIVVAPAGRLFAVLVVRVDAGRIVAYDVVADPDRVARLDLAVAAS